MTILCFKCVLRFNLKGVYEMYNIYQKTCFQSAIKAFCVRNLNISNNHMKSKVKVETIKIFFAEHSVS